MPSGARTKAKTGRLTSREGQVESPEMLGSLTAGSQWACFQFGSALAFQCGRKEEAVVVQVLGHKSALFITGISIKELVIRLKVQPGPRIQACETLAASEQRGNTLLLTDIRYQLTICNPVIPRGPSAGLSPERLP
ncbi:hypothetical protein AAFF_G00133270 [Aldrovandia affinis]|uniref:Uncharacterized protein n=1 Tax=Aldrovandia affinis TaxID=143900 RepID=A0AAD7W922_9TELE|nr:hypothetical protein AAFF_G00133270 [Aldrovandia affinis]